MDQPIFALQWHITSKCDQRCDHCYIFNSKELKIGGKDLDCNTIEKVSADFMECCVGLGAKPRIAFTGGDPLLRGDLFVILDMVRKKAKQYGFDQIAMDMMGNPFHLDELTANKLKEKGIRRYQLSLDGMKEKHDSIRMHGSFDKTLRSIDILKQAGIQVHIMFTLSKLNAEDLAPLVRLLSSLNVDAFAFARLIRPEFMSVEEYSGISFTPSEYRKYLALVDSLYKDLYNSGCKIKFPLKDHLWKLFLFEEGRFNPTIDTEKKVVYSGCGLGIGNMSILSDGTVYACRRFPSPIGRVPEEKLLNIFLNSEKLNNYRKLECFVKCSKCELLQYCRGCGASAYGVSGSFFNPDPQCWKVIG